MKSGIKLFVIERVKTRRLEMNISQRYLADSLNVSHSFIQQIEDPKTDTAYNLDHLNEIAKILKCSLKYFMPDKPV